MNRLSTKEIVLFAFLGAFMFASKQIMEWLPNIHMLGMLTMLYTVVFRKKALFPIYVFVILEGVIAGFNLWWIPYLYIWTVLWAITMLLPKSMNVKLATPVYMIVCGLHGLGYGTLYAPFQAICMGLDFKATIAWIATGLPWDIIHGIGNAFFATMIYPLSKLFRKLGANHL